MGLLVIQTVNTHIMKFLLLVSALSLASGTKLGAVTCDECKAASQGLVERLTTDASLEEQAGILIATLCPQARDADVCVRLGLCEAGRHPLVRDWTCEECTDVLAKVAEFIKDPETVEKGVAYLQGECFCGQPDHTDDCNDLVSQLLPPAMEVLSGVLIETTTELCQDVVGVC